MQTKHDSLLNLVWPFAIGFMLLTIIGVTGLEFVLGARGFSAGENIWAKNQKNATFYLLRYLHSGDPDSANAYERALRIQRYFSKARELVISAPEDTQGISEALLPTGMAPDDIDKAVRLQRYVGRSVMFQEAFDFWLAAEKSFMELDPIYQKIIVYRNMAERSQEVQDVLAGQIALIDSTIQPLEEHFARKMGEATHRVARWLVGIEILLLVTLLVGIVFRTKRILGERKQIAEALAAERQRAVITLAAIGDAVITVDEQGQVNYMNEAAHRLCQRPMPTAAEQALKLHDLVHLVDEASGKEVTSPLQQLLDSKETLLQNDSSHCLVRRDGSSVSVSWVASQIRDKEKNTGAVLVMHDTTREKLLIERLGWLALRDPLTSLFNRRAFEEQLECALKGLRTGDDERRVIQGHVLLFIDLDQFKVVNDTCGHAAGDELLRLISENVSHCLRSHDVFARMGGDEFGIILLNCSLAVGEQRAEKIRSVISQTELMWNATKFVSTASIGLVHLCASGETPNMALSAADLACYKAKDNGRNRVEVYHEGDEALAERYGEMTWVQKIHNALEDDRFLLYAQPVVPLQKDLPLHFELLLRLREENGSLVPPGVFIPAAERFGLMPLIDRWVIRHGLRQIAMNNAKDAACRENVFAINLSGATFREKGFADEVKALFDSYDVEYRQVCFEITETHAVTNLTQAVEFITRMRKLGCSFALDDFGSGMSSFGYLKHLPVDYLKIDGNLVKGICDNEVDKAMVGMINHLGHAMRTSTVGEYAETREIVEALRQCGVDFAQGYALGYPEPWSTPVEKADKDKER